MSTHIAAKPGEIADIVLLPGDPIRAEYIAQNFLTDATRYNTVRNAWGFTGTYQGTRISVQATGMGMPSISIYVNELINDYNVHTLIRVGTAGSIDPVLCRRQGLPAVAGIRHQGVGNGMCRPVPDRG